MPWRSGTRGLLPPSKASSAFTKCREFGSLKGQRLPTGGANDKITPWNTLWEEYEMTPISDPAPPKSHDTSLDTPRSDPALKDLYISFDTPPKMSIDRGVLIDRHGQLKVVSRTKAGEECPTALILHAASTNLIRDDFTRLMSEHDRTIGDDLQVIPGRHPKTLNRLPYWILLFRTPLSAASIQSRIRWYHQNAVKNLPVNPYQAALKTKPGLPSPPGYLDPESGEDVWKRLREYCILQPEQAFNVTALLPKFPTSVKRAIHLHQMWNESYRRSWNVRIRVDGDHLGPDQILRFIEEDGIARNKPWKLVDYGFINTSGHQQRVRLTSPIGIEKSHGGHEWEKVKNFSVKFHSEAEAMRFWKTWHRRPFPCAAEDESTPDHYAPLLHVEITCQGGSRAGQ